MKNCPTKRFSIGRIKYFETTSDNFKCDYLLVDANTALIWFLRNI
jgi:hypothetical protein